MCLIFAYRPVARTLCIGDVELPTSYLSVTHHVWGRSLDFLLYCPSTSEHILLKWLAFNTIVIEIHRYVTKCTCRLTALSHDKFHFIHAAGTERLFSRLFKANIQIDGFYLLLKGEESITPVATGEVAKFYPG
jgi:hypothetical protein